MDDLPFIDQHSRRLQTSAEHAWPALLSVVRTDLGVSRAALVKLLGLEPDELSGDWRGSPAAGDTLPGFRASEISPPTRLVLEGRHRFSRYALIFDLERHQEDCCTITASTWAEFPGPHGRAYRAAVIGTRGHRLLVRRMLSSVARRA